MGKSLWLIAPDSSSTDPLQTLIRTISEAHSSPAFFPHVTLASIPECISVEEIVECLQARNPVMLTFKAVELGATYFQSVFISIQETADLLELHEFVHKTLGIQVKTPHFPHMSLYYGEGKKQTIFNIFPQSPISESPYGGVEIAGIHEVLATEVWLANCEGKPEEWTILRKIQLGQACSIAG